MRVIVLALLLANLLFFGWAEWIDVPAPPPRSSIAGLPRLTLLNELSPAKRAALARKMAAARKPPPVCVSVGPFDDPATAAQAISVLQAKNFTPQQRTAQAPAVRRFWVHLDGFPSDAAVTRALHRLERGGIDDAEAMPPEAGGRRISLGLFSDRAHADRRATAVRKMGLKPRVDQRMVPGTVYWLDLMLPNRSAAVPLQDVSDLGPDGVRPAISVQPCPTTPAATAPTGSPTPTPTPTPTPVPAQTQTQAPAPQSATLDPGPLPTTRLPRCKPGGPVPCIAPKARDLAHPSVY